MSWKLLVMHVYITNIPVHSPFGLMHAHFNFVYQINSQWTDPDHCLMSWKSLKFQSGTCSLQRILLPSADTLHEQCSWAVFECKLSCYSLPQFDAPQLAVLKITYNFIRVDTSLELISIWITFQVPSLSEQLELN